jgi:hypothetical protein
MRDDVKYEMALVRLTSLCLGIAGCADENFA